MIAFNNMTADQLEAQYNLRARRPDLDEVIEGWLARSASLRTASKVSVNLPYGPGERDNLDLFPGADPDSPLLVYIHGGYWQRGDKSIYGFVAEPFVKHGVAVAIINYNLCPAVRIGEIAPQVCRALAWLWQSGPDHGYSREQIHVMGHSAGGHLAAMVMTTHWPGIDASLPADLVKSTIPISGLYELEPLVHTSINGEPKMNLEEARTESPLSLQIATSAPQLVVVGGSETDEFHRQADLYCETFGSDGRVMERYTEPEVDHFDVLNRLADESSEFFQRSLQQITR